LISKAVGKVKIDERTLKLFNPLKSKEKEVIVIKRKKLFREEIDAPQKLIDEAVTYE